MQSFSSCKSTHGSHGLAMLGHAWPRPVAPTGSVWNKSAVRLTAHPSRRGPFQAHSRPIPGPFGAHALHGILDEPTWNAARMTLGILHWGWGSFSNSIKLLANLEAELATDMWASGLGRRSGGLLAERLAWAPHPQKWLARKPQVDALWEHSVFYVFWRDAFLGFLEWLHLATTRECFI